MVYWKFTVIRSPPFSHFFQDAQDLGISIELLPLSRPDSDFNVSTFYSVWQYPLFSLFLFIICFLDCYIHHTTCFSTFMCFRIYLDSKMMILLDLCPQQEKSNLLFSVLIIGCTVIFIFSMFNLCKQLLPLFFYILFLLCICKEACNIGIGATSCFLTDLS